ncbi:MAG: Lipopolysaccharide heptosyltransferase 1 [Bryobacteraceae bacterium]|nr:Lipopolysaccharide heptosyltransferase 1 [Bryobacteraceae bacterium]
MGERILAVRLGAMGDVIHALPAVASLKSSFAGSRVAWVVEPRWAVLLDGNPYVDEVVQLNRREWRSVRAAWSRLRAMRIDRAVDFQGLIKSALVARASGARRICGYDRDGVREKAAVWFYTDARPVEAAHVVDRHLELAARCGAVARRAVFPLPEGSIEGELPAEFVLASPFAGWPSKEWPLERYGELARILRRSCGMPLVLNGHPAAEAALRGVEDAVPHVCSISGLISATRRARAVVGVDSGPLHLAAALGKPGVAIYGPTDPLRNGPYGGSIRVLRARDAVTSYKRRRETDPSMMAITPRAVAAELEQCLAGGPV